MVNTFIVNKCFRKSATQLDPTRLWKQVIEAKSILHTLTGIKKGWANHPAVLQWKGYEDCLKFYYNCHLKEWLDRGYKNNTQSYYEVDEKKVEFPYWTSCDLYINSHKASLMRKSPSYYGDKFPEVPKLYLEAGYFWPSKFTEDEVLKSKPEKILEQLGEWKQELCKGKDKAGKGCEFRAKKKGYCLRHFNKKSLV